MVSTNGVIVDANPTASLPAHWTRASRVSVSLLLLGASLSLLTPSANADSYGPSCIAALDPTCQAASDCVESPPCDADPNPNQCEAFSYRLAQVACRSPLDCQASNLGAGQQLRDCMPEVVLCPAYGATTPVTMCTYSCEPDPVYHLTDCPSPCQPTDYGFGWYDLGVSGLPRTPVPVPVEGLVCYSTACMPQISGGTNLLPPGTGGGSCSLWLPSLALLASSPPQSNCPPGTNVAVHIAWSSGHHTIACI